MPTVNASPIGVKPQFMLATGLPASGYKLFWYVAGSTSTKQNTYTDSTGTVANTNPLVMNTLGEPATQIWLTAGQAYKAVLAPSTDTDPPTSPVWTIDNLRGINDTSVTIDQWVAGPAPTYIGATQFSLVGDQTSTFQVGRRIKATVTAGTVYGYISVSAYAAVTTVTVVLDSGALDSGLSAVSYGLISPLNSSLATAAFRYTGTSSGNVPVLDANGKLVPGVLDPDFQQLNVSASAGALTISVLAGEFLEFRVNNVRQQYAVANTISMVVPSGGTLGVATTTTGRIWVVAMWNGGTPELACINTWDGTNILEILPFDSISTTAVGAGSTSAQVWYSTTLRNSQEIAILGYFEAVNTAGAWASPTLAVGFGPGIPLPGQVIQTRRPTPVNTLTTLTATTPADNTPPQIGEGTQLSSVSFTARSALNIIDIEGWVMGAFATAANRAILALHVATADAFAAEITGVSASDAAVNAMVRGRTMAGSASAQTLSFRVGVTAGTFYVNGNAAGTRLFGGADTSGMQVREIMR